MYVCAYVCVYACMWVHVLCMYVCLSMYMYTHEGKSARYVWFYVCTCVVCVRITVYVK